MTPPGGTVLAAREMDCAEREVRQSVLTRSDPCGDDFRQIYGDIASAYRSRNRQRRGGPQRPSLADPTAAALPLLKAAAGRGFEPCTRHGDETAPDVGQRGAGAVFSDARTATRWTLW